MKWSFSCRKGPQDNEPGRRVAFVHWASAAEGAEEVTCSVRRQLHPSPGLIPQGHQDAEVNDRLQNAPWPGKSLPAWATSLP